MATAAPMWWRSLLGSAQISFSDLAAPLLQAELAPTGRARRVAEITSTRPRTTRGNSASTLAPSTEPPDAELARRAGAGDERAFTTLVRRYERPVFALCCRYLGQADAADAAQETFVRAVTHL